MKKIQTTSLKVKIREKQKELADLCADQTKARKLIKELLALKAQEDIVPTELIVPIDSVIDTIDLDAIVFKICNNGIYFHAKSGYSAFIEPRCKGLFSELLETLTESKRLSELTDKEKEEVGEEYIENVKGYFNAWTHIMQMPIAASISPIILFDTINAFLHSFNEYAANALNQPLAPEDVEELLANAEAQAQEEVLDKMKETFDND